MSMADLLAGARPGITPPYAPETALPSLPPSQGPAGQKGLGGFLNRFLEPTNALGQFGRALVMAGGTPLGTAYALMDRQKERGAESDLDRRYKEAQIAHLSAPEAEQKTALQRNYEYFQSLGKSDLADSYLQAEGAPMAALEVTGPDGSKSLQFYPKGGRLPGAMAPPTNTPPAAAIDRLRQNPHTAADFDAMFGPGSAARILGGATGNPSPTFPVMDAVIQQESGGRIGARGPKTRYGQALGQTQLLPATAQEMAGKLGLPWRPELLTDTSETGARYQRALGEAYLQQGMAETGNLTDALHYYHGGPNRRMWGPKTRAYADSVLSRMGGMR